MHSFLGEKLLACMVVIRSAIVDISSFPSVSTNFHPHQQCNRVLMDFYLCQYQVLFVSLLILAILAKCGLSLWIVFIYIVPGVELLSICILPIWMSSFVKYLFKSFVYFILGCFLNNLWFFIHSLDREFFVRYMLANIFSKSVACLFTLLTGWCLLIHRNS